MLMMLLMLLLSLLRFLLLFEGFVDVVALVDCNSYCSCSYDITTKKDTIADF